MNKLIATILLFAFLAATAFAQGEIRVNPTNVNVYSQGSTTVFLTYGNLGNYRPAQTTWCGDVQPATPAIGLMCVPGTIYGTLPSRYDISRLSGNGAGVPFSLTDVQLDFGAGKGPRASGQEPLVLFIESGGQGAANSRRDQIHRHWTLARALGGRPARRSLAGIARPLA